MGRPDKSREREDELDWHTPLHDQKEFQQYAREVVLPRVTKKPLARRRVKLRISRALIVEHWIDEALNYLALQDLIHLELRGEITYVTSVVPPRKIVKQLGRHDFKLGRSASRRADKTRPDWQQHVPERTA